MKEPAIVFSSDEANQLESYLRRFYECVNVMPDVMKRFDQERIADHIQDVRQRERIEKLIVMIEERVS